MSTANTWRTTELQALATIDPETLGANTDADYHFHYIDVAAVSEGKIDIPSISMAFRGSPSRARKVVKRGDVLMATVRPNLKAFAYFDTELDDCVASTGFAVLRAKEDVDAQFVLYSILSEPIARQIDAHIVGSNYPAITTTSVSRLKVLAPPFAEQSKIAEVLSTVDRAIAQTEGLIAKQQRIKTGLMQDLLTRGIDEHGQLRSEATHAFKDSPLGRIPVEWEVTTVDEIATITTGDKDTQDADASAAYPFFVRSQTIERISSYSFDGEAVLTAGDGVGTGKVFHYIDGRFDYHQRVYCMHSFTNGVLGYYFFCYFREHFMARVAQFSAKGSVDSVRRHMIAKMVTPRPSADEQTEVVRILREAARCIADYDETLEKLRSLKTALMQDLLTGKVRVTPLLERIKEATA